MNSAWFRLFLYELLGAGPVSLLVTKGARLRRFPRPLRPFRRLLLCTWSHDPGLVCADSALPILNEALQHSAVFLQVRRDHFIKYLCIPDEISRVSALMLPHCYNMLNRHHSLHYSSFCNLYPHTLVGRVGFAVFHLQAYSEAAFDGNEVVHLAFPDCQPALETAESNENDRYGMCLLLY